MRGVIAGLCLSFGLLIGATGAGAADVDVETDYAPEMSGWYLAVSGGLNRVFDIDYEADAGLTTFDTDGEIEFDYGIRGGAALGHRFDNNLRGEVEFAYSSTDADEVDGEGVDGSLDIFSILAKLDFEMEFFGWWHPYIGIGAGLAHVSIDDIGDVDIADSDDTVFAAAIQGGSMFVLTESVELFTQTQLMFLGDIDGDLGTDSVELDSPVIMSSSVGLRINF
jgi:opacity protein-like surface antigen